MAQALLPRLTVQGTQFVNPAGKPVLLKGCNVGNWLINEFWMMGTEGQAHVPVDQWNLERTLTRRFGSAEDVRLMNVFRSSWMTERDWQNIQSYHFNLIRVPFNYRLLEDDDRPKELRPDAFRWLDHAVSEANSHGLYVILDLHGVQGGQTLNDHTGRSGQNKLWSVPENQERMAWLWRQIAQHFRGRNNVIGYDPMNEPYGGTKPQVVAVFKKAYAAIRSVDPDTLIFAHGATDNFDHFGDPKANGWHNVGFQMHYYPGLFGDSPRIKSNISHLHRLQYVAAKVKTLDVPFLVGEMNIVLSKSGGASMMRRVFDAHASYGWLTTMWSYKVVTAKGGVDGGSWGMFTNAEPAAKVDFEEGSEQQIEDYFKSFATQELMPYEELRRDLTEAHPTLEPLPASETPRTVAPAEDTLSGWTATDIGGALKGGLVSHGNTFDLYGGGDDIWGSSDQFRFLSKKANGDFELEATLESVEDTQGYTKGGLMVRGSLDPDAATVLFSVFPTGGTQIGVRAEDKGSIEATNAPDTRLPGSKLTISRRGTTLTFFVNGVQVGQKDVPSLSGPVYVGPIALSHTNGELTKITYRDLHLIN
jgi:glucan 1,3-beta-glucosidase